MSGYESRSGLISSLGGSNNSTYVNRNNTVRGLISSRISTGTRNITLRGAGVSCIDCPPGPAGPAGPAGATGATGPQGPAGADGADGKTILNGSGVPVLVVQMVTFILIQPIMKFMDLRRMVLGELAHP
jgi:hypothetical protein